ncbi:MAG: hypothetical protein H6Q69_3699 [Firmicutes bacterium]|nr:hypothetical protein [Bacillota bacterium]MBP2660667.1 hypothetical protein [Bacillota bacterium]
MNHAFKKWFAILFLVILITGMVGVGLCFASSNAIENSQINFNKMPGIDTHGDTPNMIFAVGAGRYAIDIPDSFFPEHGFVGVHDKLYTRTLLMDNGAKRTALVVVDFTSLDTEQISGLKEIVSRAGDVDLSNIFICTNHTFSAPHIKSTLGLTDTEKGKNDILRRALDDSISNSVTSAKKDMQPAKIGYGVGSCNVNVNRDLLTAEGWWHGSNEHGISDKDVAVIQFEDLKGNPIAVFMNYAVQSSIMNESVLENSGQLVTSDLGGATVRHIEQQYNDNGTIALFTIGAAGDQEPIFTSNHYTIDKNGQSSRSDIHDAGYVLVDLLGERLGSEAVRVSEGIHAVQSQVPLRIVKDSVRCKGQLMSAHIADIHPTKKYNYQSNGEIDVPIEIMQIGDIALVGVQPELACQIGIDIKKKSPFKNTVVMTLVNGAAKYMADENSYDKFTYEARNSQYAKGSAECVEDKILSMLETLK